MYKYGPKFMTFLKCSDDMWMLPTPTNLEYSDKEWDNSSGIDSNYSCKSAVPFFFEDMVPLQN